MKLLIGSVLLSETELRRRCTFEHPDAAILLEGAAFEKVKVGNF